MELPAPRLAERSLVEPPVLLMLKLETVEFAVSDSSFDSHPYNYGDKVVVCGYRLSL